MHAVPEVKASHDLGLAVHQRIFGDVEPEHLEARTRFHQIFDQKSFGATHVEYAVTRLQPPMLDHVLGDRHPAAIVAIPSIAGIARAVEIIAPVLAADTDILFALGGG